MLGKVLGGAVGGLVGGAGLIGGALASSTGALPYLAAAGAIGASAKVGGSKLSSMMGSDSVDTSGDIKEEESKQTQYGMLSNDKLDQIYDNIVEVKNGLAGQEDPKSAAREERLDKQVKHKELIAAIMGRGRVIGDKVISQGKSILDGLLPLLGLVLGLAALPKFLEMLPKIIETISSVMDNISEFMSDLDGFFKNLGLEFSALPAVISSSILKGLKKPKLKPTTGGQNKGGKGRRTRIGRIIQNNLQKQADRRAAKKAAADAEKTRKAETKAKAKAERLKVQAQLKAEADARKIASQKLKAELEAERLRKANALKLAQEKRLKYDRGRGGGKTPILKPFTGGQNKGGAARRSIIAAATRLVPTSGPNRGGASRLDLRKGMNPSVTRRAATSISKAASGVASSPVVQSTMDRGSRMATAAGQKALDMIKKMGPAGEKLLKVIAKIAGKPFKATGKFLLKWLGPAYLGYATWNLTSKWNKENEKLNLENGENNMLPTGNDNAADKAWLEGMQRLAAEYGGGYFGAVAGGVLGSMISPGVGTFLGSVLGGITGALGGGAIFDLATAKDSQVEGGRAISFTEGADSRQLGRLSNRTRIEEGDNPDQALDMIGRESLNTQTFQSELSLLEQENPDNTFTVIQYYQDTKNTSISNTSSNTTTDIHTDNSSIPIYGDVNGAY